MLEIFQNGEVDQREYQPSIDVDTNKFRRLPKNSDMTLIDE